MKNEPQTIEQIYAQALEQLEAGFSFEQVLSKFPEHKTKLLPILETAMRIQMAAEKIDPSKKALEQILKNIPKTEPTTNTSAFSHGKDTRNAFTHIMWLTKSFFTSRITKVAVPALAVVVIVATGYVRARHKNDLAKLLPPPNVVGGTLEQVATGDEDINTLVDSIGKDSGEEQAALNSDVENSSVSPDDTTINTYEDAIQTDEF